jgi:acyl-coenzyme A synthetase/AMP-(fatty) acid ligase
MFNFRVELHKIWEEFSEKILIEDDLVHWTGKEIAEKISKISSNIINSTPNNSRVGLCFPNWASLGLAFLSCIEAGRVPVLIDYLDINESDEEWLQRKQLSCVITDDSLEIEFPQFYPVFQMNRYGDLRPKSEFLKPSAISSQLKSPPKGTFVILYTSGSTGQSKGIFIPEEGVLKTVDFLKAHFHLDDSVVAPIILPICYSMALNTQFLPTLLSGGKSVFINSRLNYNKLYQSILNSSGTFLALIGDILHTCWEEKNKRKLPPAESVKHIQLAGGTILSEHLKMARELFPNAIVHKGYGLTEAIRVSMITSEDPDFLTESVGMPLPFVEVEIRNEENKAVDVNEVGEVFVKGPNVLLGICSRYEKVTDEKNFFASGDLGYLNDKGHLIILGRKDGVFKIQGRRLSGFIYERDALVASAIVKGAKCVSVDDEKRLTQKIVLFLEINKNLGTAENASLEAVDLIKCLESELKKHSFYPKDIVIVYKLPRTNNGKIQLSNLKTMWSEKQNLDRLISINSTLKVYYYQKTEAPFFANDPKAILNNHIYIINPVQINENKRKDKVIVYETEEQNR